MIPKNEVLENFLIKCFSLLNEVIVISGETLFFKGIFPFQVVLLYCVAMSVYGFLMDAYNSKVQYRFTEEDWYEERPLVDRATHFSSLLPAISLLTVAVTVAKR